MFILAKENSIANNILIELRDKHIQKDRAKFRSNIEQLGSLLAYEISKSLSYKSMEIQTPLGVKKQNGLLEYPNLVCVMRAGMPFFQGFLNVFDKSDCGFLGAYRSTSGNKDEIQIEASYFTKPNLDNKDLIIVDPMLATGKSFVKAIKGIREKFKPKSIHIAALVASIDGIEYINQNIESEIWTVDMDDHLNEHAYIVPGLGDAGDLSFGEKI
ncbi:uracil phosphoribosyltransferase [Hyphobacterium sp. CCMP332]|nr:uracil phosphoribosyltransferase [Hyphobacterium sp. CCMP332]